MPHFSPMRTMVAIVLVGLGAGCIPHRSHRPPVSDVPQRGRGGDRPQWAGLFPCGGRRDTISTRLRPDSACIAPDPKDGPAIAPGTKMP